MNPVIPVFVASPTDVSEERTIAEEAVHALAPRLARLFGVTVVPMLWEQFAPISSADASHPQQDILKMIRPYSIFIGILWKRYGTPIPDLNMPGTEAEFKHALKNRDRINILSYFRKVDSGKNQKKTLTGELERVIALENELKASNLLVATYCDPDEFRQRIIGDLTEAALKMILTPEPMQLRHYVDFFKFGDVLANRSKPILIVYPPVTDPGPSGKSIKMPWQERLLPHVIYEDFKAIQDIEGAMRLLGHEYRTLTTDSPELDLADPGDRVWVCVPRNLQAQEVLKSLGSRCRFRFESRKFDDWPNQERYIAWTNCEEKQITIRSPLGKYLMSSPRPGGQSMWDPLYGYTYGRDYGVLARFRVDPGPPADNGQSYYHYFIGGIRGLGTWGIGWFIDHCAGRLSLISKQKEGTLQDNNSDDLQFLLEVTYRDYRITNVCDVSQEPQKFFDERFSKKYVRHAIAEAHPLAHR